MWYGSSILCSCICTRARMRRRRWSIGVMERGEFELRRRCSIAKFCISKVVCTRILYVAVRSAGVCFVVYSRPWCSRLPELQCFSTFLVFLFAKESNSVCLDFAVFFCATFFIRFPKKSEGRETTYSILQAAHEPPDVTIIVEENSQIPCQNTQTTWQSGLRSQSATDALVRVLGYPRCREHISGEKGQMS